MSSRTHGLPGCLCPLRSQFCRRSGNSKAITVPPALRFSLLRRETRGFTIIYGFTRNLRIPYVEQWNLSTQYEFLKGWVAEVGYIGSHGVACWSSQASTWRNWSTGESWR